MHYQLVDNAFSVFLCLMCLILVVSVLRIVNGVVKTAALFAFKRLTRDEIAHVDHVAKFANVACCLHLLVELCCLLVQEVETRRSTFQTKVRTYNAYVS